MSRLTVRPLAWREINAHLDYLEEKAGIETAERFFDLLINSFQALADSPRMGAFCGLSGSATLRTRRWPVKGFENWLIFYRARRDGVEIQHVIHGARDLENLV
jgi:toxin ParE1/3/4